MPKSRPPYAAEFRRQMVELVRSGRTPEALAREFEPSAQAIRNWVALAGIPAGLRHPIPDGLGRRLELPCQSLRRAPRPDQLDHLPAELRRIRRSRFRHRRYLLLPTG